MMPRRYSAARRSCINQIPKIMKRSGDETNCIQRVDEEEWIEVSSVMNTKEKISLRASLLGKKTSSIRSLYTNTTACTSARSIKTEEEEDLFNLINEVTKNVQP